MRSLATAPVLRFAPSPNGALHLGHAYSALINERIAAEINGRVLLRIEDLDRTRCKPQFEAAIIDDLAWLGLRFPRRRAGRASMATTTRRRSPASIGGAWSTPVFAAARRSRAPRTDERDPDGAPLYPGTCRALSPAEARDRLARGDKAAFRLDMRRAIDAGPARLCWTEYGEGAVPSQRSAAPEVWGDVVLRGRDLAASYHLAVVVDDALAGRDRRRARARPACRDRGPPPAAGAARPCRAALSAPPARSRPRRSETVEKPSILVACRIARDRLEPRAKFARRWDSAQAPASDLRLSSVEVPRSRRLARRRASPPTSPRRRGPRP